MPISRGSVQPGIFCVPSFAGRSGAQEYARFASGFRGNRDVSVIPSPGFADGEPMAATVDALIGVYSENIKRYADGASFVLAGHSSGGVVAHALAAQLDSIGSAPTAHVLMDVYSPGTEQWSERYWSRLPSSVLSGNAEHADSGEDAWLTAMADYFALDWSGLPMTAIPTLLVRAEIPLGRSKPSWGFSSRLTVVDVPGDHFAMMRDHANTTAQAVNEWLTEL